MFIRARARREVLEEGIVAIRADQEGETRAGHQIVVFCEKGRGGEGKAKGRRREGEGEAKGRRESEEREQRKRTQRKEKKDVIDFFFGRIERSVGLGWVGVSSSTGVSARCPSISIFIMRLFWGNLFLPLHLRANSPT